MIPRKVKKKKEATDYSISVNWHHGEVASAFKQLMILLFKPGSSQKEAQKAKENNQE